MWSWGAGCSSHTCANRPEFVDLERQILTRSFVLSGPSPSDLPAMSGGSLSQLAFPSPSLAEMAWPLLGYPIPRTGPFSEQQGWDGLAWIIATLVISTGRCISPVFYCETCLWVHWSSSLVSFRNGDAFWWCARIHTRMHTGTRAVQVLCSSMSPRDQSTLKKMPGAISIHLSWSEVQALFVGQVLANWAKWGQFFAF